MAACLMMMTSQEVMTMFEPETAAKVNELIRRLCDAVTDSEEVKALADLVAAVQEPAPASEPVNLTINGFLVPAEPEDEDE